MLGVYVLFTYVLFEEPSLIASNQQIYDLYKWIIFEKKRHPGKQFFDISELCILCNKDSCCEHITGGVNIYLHGCVCLLAPECAVYLSVCVCLCVCDIKLKYQQKTTLCDRPQ